MAGASTSEAGQTAASTAGRTEEEERRKKVHNLSAALNMDSNKMSDVQIHWFLCNISSQVSLKDLTGVYWDYSQNKMK